MAPRFISLTWSLSWALNSNILFEILTWTSNWHIKLNITNIEFPTQHVFASSFSFPYIILLSAQLLKPKTQESCSIPPSPPPHILNLLIISSKYMLGLLLLCFFSAPVPLQAIITLTWPTMKSPIWFPHFHSHPLTHCLQNSQWGSLKTNKPYYVTALFRINQWLLIAFWIKSKFLLLVPAYLWGLFSYHFPSSLDCNHADLHIVPGSCQDHCHLRAFAFTIPST